MKTNDQINIVLVAQEATGVQALRQILNSAHNLVGVLTSTDSLISEMAGKLGIPVLEASRVMDPEFAAWMSSHHIDVLLNVHSLYRICPEVIHAARVGAFNLHPGPLPRYSGSNVPSWAVYNQEPTHTVTLHHITDKIDTGNIVYEKQFPLTSTDTGLSVSISCAHKGLELIERLLKDLSRDPLSIPGRSQDLSQRKFYKRGEIPGNGYIQWTDPACKIDAFLRASNYSPFASPWGEPKTRWQDKNLSILKSEISNGFCNEVPGTVGQMLNGKTAIATSDYWLLIDKCKLNGETVTAASFLNHEDLLTSDF